MMMMTEQGKVSTVPAIVDAYKASKARVAARKRMEKGSTEYAALAFNRADRIATTKINANREKFFLIRGGKSCAKLK